MTTTLYVYQNGVQNQPQNATILSRLSA